MMQSATVIQLKPETLEAFQSYIRDAEAAMQPSLHGAAPFLWSGENPDRAARLRKGDVPARPFSADLPLHVPGGLIHDWIGAAFIPGATLLQTLACVQNYDNHKNIYQPEVVDSRLLTHTGSGYTIFLRLLKKKIITVVLDTYHDVHYQSVGDGGCFCRSYTTRIDEVDDAGTPKEKIYPLDTGYGFMWRLNSYWRFQEEKAGLVVECRAVSLSRDIPRGLGFIIEPIIKTLPRESLVNTLKATRNALPAKP